MDAILNNIQTNFNLLISEMNEQQYDKIRFASYRTASKIRFIQKKTNLYLIDLLNAIETLRQNGLNQVQDVNSEMTVHQLYQITQSLFLELNKRLPRSQNIDITSSITNLLSFMIYANDVNQSGKINVLFVKIIFCTLSSGRFQDKLKYIFSQIVDPSNNNIMMVKFCAFLKSLLQLACTVNESQFYTYEEQVAKTIFQTILLPSLDLKAFNRLFYSSNGPPNILSWFVIMHKMAQVEFVIHPTICNICSTSNFTGFRYKCVKCYNFNLCQNCFWTGRSSGSHNSEVHSCKEYVNYKSTSKQLSNSLKRSFRLKSSPKHKIELNDDVNHFAKINSLQNYYDTNNVSPYSQIQDFDDNASNLTYDNVESMDEDQYENQLYYVDQSNQMNRLIANSPQYIIVEQNQQNNTWPLRQTIQFVPDFDFELDDEHKLISQYAASLANSNSLNSLVVESYDEFGNPVQHSITIDSHLDDYLNDGLINEQLVECVAAYELKNRSLMNEIIRLRDLSPSSDYNSLVNSNSQNMRSLSRFSNSPVLSVKSQQEVVAAEELCYLREKHNELENHLQVLLMNKEELKNKLNQTLKISKNIQDICSTPPSSVNSTLTKKETLALKTDLNDLHKTAIERDKMFEETQDLLTEEMYQKSIQSHQDELDEEINKVQKEQQKEQEEKDLLDDFDRLLKVENTTNRLMNEVKNQNQINTNHNHTSSVINATIGNNDEATSDESVTLQEELPSKKNQGNLYNRQNESSNRDLEANGREENKIEIRLNNNSISGLMNDKFDSYKAQIESNNYSHAEFNEETNSKSTSNQPKSNRVNKYELAYSKKSDSNNVNSINNNDKVKNQNNLTKKDDRLRNQSSFNENDKLSVKIKETPNQLDVKGNTAASRRENRLFTRLSSENSIDEISETNNSISSNSTYLYKFDVKTQPPMAFSSIAYVNANRLHNQSASNLNSTNNNRNLFLNNQTISNPTSSLNKLMNLGSSNTSSDLPMYKLGESLDDSSLNTDRINLQEEICCNLSLSSSTDNELRENTESIKSSDTDDCPTLIDEY